jgi:hypothetical protein
VFKNRGYCVLSKALREVSVPEYNEEIASSCHRYTLGVKFSFRSAEQTTMQENSDSEEFP